MSTKAVVGFQGSQPSITNKEFQNMQEKTFINNQLGIKFNSYIDQKCRVWFKAKEVAEILGYKNTVDAIKRHVSENHKMLRLCCPPETGCQQKGCQRETRGQQKDKKGCQRETGCQQNDTRGKYCLFIDEAGFYELVFKSKLETAKVFREWVFSKVLPSIRKYGYYRMIDSRAKQRVIFDGKKYYKHPVFTNYAASKNGDILSLKSEKILKMIKDSGGYLFFKIYDEKLEKAKNYLHHRFVYEVFRGPIPRCFEVDHVNEIKTDNRIKNLQLLTPKQNSGKSNNRAIISTCIETGKERRYISIKQAAIELDIHSTSISNICCKRKSFKTATSKKDGKTYLFKYLDYKIK